MSQEWQRSAFNTAVRSPLGELNKFRLRLPAQTMFEVLASRSVAPITERSTQTSPDDPNYKDTSAGPVINQLVSVMDWSQLPPPVPDPTLPEPWSVVSAWLETDIPSGVAGYNPGLGEALGGFVPLSQAIDRIQPPWEGNLQGFISPSSYWIYTGGFDQQFVLNGFFTDGWRNEIQGWRERIAWDVDFSVFWASASIYAAYWPGWFTNPETDWDQKNESLKTGPVNDPTNLILYGVRDVYTKFVNVKVQGSRIVSKKTWFEVPFPIAGPMTDLSSGLIGQIMFAIVNEDPATWSKRTGIPFA